MLERSYDTAFINKVVNDPAVRPYVGGGVDGVVEFCVGHRTFVVDDRQPVRMTTGVECRDHPDLTPTTHVGDHRREILRRLQTDRTGGEGRVGVVEGGRAARGGVGDVLGGGGAEMRETHEIEPR